MSFPGLALVSRRFGSLARPRDFSNCDSECLDIEENKITKMVLGDNAISCVLVSIPV